jgi:hypothetical protein
VIEERAERLEGGGTWYHCCGYLFFPYGPVPEDFSNMCERYPDGRPDSDGTKPDGCVELFAGLRPCLRCGTPTEMKCNQKYCKPCRLEVDRQHGRNCYARVTGHLPPLEGKRIKEPMTPENKATLEAHIREGKTTYEIAELMGKSLHVIKKHAAKIRKRLGMGRRVVRR